MLNMNKEEIKQDSYDTTMYFEDMEMMVKSILMDFLAM